MAIGQKILRVSISISKFTLMLPGLITVFLLVLLSACSPDSQIDPGGINYGNNQQTEDFEVLDDDFETTIDPENLPSREPNSCPNLDSQLYQLTQSEDPISLAEQMGFKVRDDKVQVLFVLKNEDPDFLLDFDVELGTQSGNQVQGYVSVDLLCELANEDEVLAIRPVDKIY